MTCVTVMLKKFCQYFVGKLYPEFVLVLLLQLCTFLDGSTHLAIVQGHLILAKCWWCYWLEVMRLHYDNMLPSHVSWKWMLTAHWRWKLTELIRPNKETWHDISLYLLFWVQYMCSYNQASGTVNLQLPLSAFGSGTLSSFAAGAWNFNIDPEER